MDKCMKPGCTNDAKYAVQFEAYALGNEKTRRNRVTGHFNLVLCDSHTKTAQASDLINARSWEAIQTNFLAKGKALLDRSTCELKFVLIA